MFKVKHLPLSLPFYDRLGIERWLHKQAAAGWYLESAGHVFWRFRKGDPKVLHYAVVYQPALDPDDPASEPRALQFAQYCAHAGWLLVSDSARMQIYSNDSTAPLPIETDPLLELDRIHATAKKSYLRHAYLCVLASALHLLTFFYGSAAYHPSFSPVTAQSFMPLHRSCCWHWLSAMLPVITGGTARQNLHLRWAPERPMSKGERSVFY